MRYYIIVSCLALLSLTAFRFWDSFTIHGKVTDVSGAPIVNATVLVKGTRTATTTDATGAFTLQVNKNKVTLVISSVGFDVKEVLVQNDGKLVTITLAASTANLQEVLVTSGYGNKKYRKNKLVMRGLSSAPTFQYSFTPSKQYERDSRKPSAYGDSTVAIPDWNTEGYDAIVENRFLTSMDNPLSTFSIDVDAAAYSNIRRFLQSGQMPPAGAVRIEEMINYFRYEYPQPADDQPFSINTEIANCPWNNKHKLALIGLQGKQIPTDNLPASNLVFLIDVSGSMDEPNKLPLVQASMKLLVEQLRQQDRVAMVVYAGSAGLVLPSTDGAEKIKIKDAIDKLEAGGSTAGGEGIKLAYKVAKQNFIKGGNNRVILCTDGDFNVGVSSNDELERLIENERKSGVFLTVLGYGTGNYQDSKMQGLADKGNGNHSYIDNLSEARKVLVSEFGGTLFTIAKDVKLQIEFNPSKVQAYRLIGYENRLLNKEDFNNDQKDAGELGSGHTVTALYEIIPVGVTSSFIEKVDPLKYQSRPSVVSNTSEMMTIKFRYKNPDEDVSKLLEQVVMDKNMSLNSTSTNFRFAAAVASFGMLLRNSEFKQECSYDQTWKLAKDALGNDDEGYRSEFLKLLKNAQAIAKVKKPDEVLVKE